MNKKRVILLIVILSILVVTLSITYAYYASGVSGTTDVNATSTTVTSQIGEVEFNGEDTFDSADLDEIYPGFIGVQTFTISPYRDGSNIYEIDLQATVPSTFGNDIKLTLYKTSNVAVNNIEREEGSLTITNDQFVKQDTLTINGTLTKVYEGSLVTTTETVLEQVEFTILNDAFTTPTVTPDGEYTYYAVYEYLNNGDQNSQQGFNFSSKITVKYLGELPLPADTTLGYLNSFNSVYTLTNSDKCAQFAADGSIINPNTQAMSDSDTPIICEAEDDYGTSYYLRGLHTNNDVKFADSCWKIVRVTGTGGIKMIYNGDVDGSGTCTTTSGDHNGFTGQTLSLSGNKLYGTSYTKEGDTYTLTDTSTLNWPNDTSSIIGKYTCNSTSSTCNTLYAVTGEYNTSSAYGVKLDQSTNYAQIGTSAFYASYKSPAYVGYMFNDAYTYNSKNLSGNSNNYYYGASFTYDSNNTRPYTLTDTVQFADISDSTNKTSLNTHHYTCFYSTDNTCQELYFIYYLSGTYVYYIKLNGNETVSDALDKMLRNDNINVKNSHIKGVIDYWYKENILGTTYESYLEDTVYCNDRTIDDIGGWSETGTLRYLKFNAYNNKYYLKCPNKRDAFTVSDITKGNGALTYPVGLLTTAEHSLIGNYTANTTGDYYWASAPSYFNVDYAVERGVSTSDFWYKNGRVNISGGARPAVSLRPGTAFKSGGDGSASNPLEVE